MSKVKVKFLENFLNITIHTRNLILSGLFDCMALRCSKVQSGWAMCQCSVGVSHVSLFNEAHKDTN